ncbi:MAG TPA: YIP1 family protein [Terriglobales bacterium]|jgi:hypothetical protein
MSEAVSAIPVEGKPLTEVERVVDTFIAPSKTFTDIRRNASWWLPYILIAACWIAMAYVADSKVGFETIVNNQLRLSPKQADRLEQLPPDQRAEQTKAMVKGNRIFWFYIAPVAALLLAVIMAGIYMGTFNFGFGAELKFKQCLAVFMYASLPLIIKTGIAILVFFVGGGEGFTFQNPVASNLSGLVDPNSHFLYNVAANVDIFLIWTLILTGIAYSCLTRVKRSTCMAVVFAWWVVFTLFFSGLGALFA